MTPITIIYPWKKRIHHFETFTFLKMSSAKKTITNFISFVYKMLIIYNYDVCNVIFYCYRDVVTRLLWYFNDSLQDTLLSNLIFCSLYPFYYILTLCHIIISRIHHFSTSRIIYIVSCNVEDGITNVFYFSPKAQLKRKWVPLLTL